MKEELTRPITNNLLNSKEVKAMRGTGKNKWWFYCQHPAGFMQFLDLMHANSKEEAIEKVLKCLPGLSELEKRTMVVFDKQQNI